MVAVVIDILKPVRRWSRGKLGRLSSVGASARCLWRLMVRRRIGRIFGILIAARGRLSLGLLIVLLLPPYQGALCMNIILCGAVSYCRKITASHHWNHLRHLSSSGEGRQII